MAHTADWSQFDVQKLYDALARIIGENEGLDIKFTLTKKSEEQLAMERAMQQEKEA